MGSHKILVVDDDGQVRMLLRNLLEREGYRIGEAANSKQMSARLEQDLPSLITLDLNLGGEDGLTLAREIRSKYDLPIIMITAKADEVDRIVGLELGADDYITKPFNLREVLARIRAVLRRYEAPPRVGPSALASDHECYSFADWVLDTTARELRNTNGSLTELTNAEFNLLELFVKRPARVLSRAVIMDMMKGQEWTPVDRAVDALVGRLRKKIERDPERPALIKTVRGVGYAFAAETQRGDAMKTR